MRFLLVFPLVFLLILGSFVSIDAVPQSVFTPVPPWSTHKPRLKRSIDDSNSTADYDSLSLDQLTKLLEETKKEAEKEKTVLEAANSLLIAKKAEYDKAKEEYDKKKEEWDKWKEFPVLTKASEEAQKIIIANQMKIPRLNDSYLNREEAFLKAQTDFKNAEEFLKDLKNPDSALSRLDEESRQLTQDITTQDQKVNSLFDEMVNLNSKWIALKGHESGFTVEYNNGNCGDTQQATIEPCASIIAKLDEIKQAENAFNAASQTHKAAEDLVQELKTKLTETAQKIRRLKRDKSNPHAIGSAENALSDKESEKEDAEKALLEAKTTLQAAEEEFTKANATKTDADQKLSEFLPGTAKKESEANTAQDKAGKEKTRLEGELANLKADKEEKEKNWNATSAKVAELLQRKDKKGSVSTGGGNLALIIGPIVAIIALCLIGVAVFVFVKSRKRPANENEPKKEADKEALPGVAGEPVDKVATETKSASAKTDNPAVPPTGAVPCSDKRQLIINGQLVSMDDSWWMEMNEQHETTRADKPPNEILASVLFKDLPPEVHQKARDLIQQKIKDVKKTKIDVYEDWVVFEKKFGHEQVTLDGHDSKPVYKANVFPFRKDTYETVQEPKDSSQQLPSYADGLVPPIREGFMAILCDSSIPGISKYKEMDERREEEELRKAERERDQAGQEELPTARQPVSEPHDITERTQKSVSGTQQEAAKEDGAPVARIPDDKSMVTGTLKEEGKPEIDKSLVEKTAIPPSGRDQLQECTGISGPEPPAVTGGRKRGSRASQVSDCNGSKNSKTKALNTLQGVRKRSKESKKKKEKWWHRLDFMNRSRSTSSSHSDSSYGVLRELTDRLARDAEAARNTTASASVATLPNFTKAELRKLEFYFAGHKMDKRELNEAVAVIYQIFDQIGTLFYNESRVLETHTPASVVTDIHGNLARLLHIFNSYHTPTELAWRYHRGDNSLQVLLVLFVLKISYPDNLMLVRGNHEDPKCNIGYGFFDELDKWFGEEVCDDRGRRMVPSELSNEMKRRVSKVYARMPVAARIDKKIFCCHGSVPDYKGNGLIAKINAQPHVIDDPRDPKYDVVSQLLWNDTAHGVHGSEPNFSRGFGRIIGADTIDSVCKENDISMIVEGHQMMSLGFEAFAGGRVMVVFSSANYVKNFDNHGAVIDFNNGGYAIRKVFMEDKLGPKAAKRKARRFHSKHWLGSDIKTREHNKKMEKIMLEKSKGKDPQVEQADKKTEEPKKAKENQIPDENVKKKASQLEQAADKSEKPVFSTTMAPT